MDCYRVTTIIIWCYYEDNMLSTFIYYIFTTYSSNVFVV